MNDIATVDLAFMTGHKLTNIGRQIVSPMVGQVYFARLDGGPFERLTDIRKRLESQYLQAEARQGTPVQNH